MALHPRHRSLMVRIGDEQGMTMVIALLVVFVVLILSSIVVQQAIHNVDQSGRDRDRLLSVDAAEAGLDWFYNHLETTTLQDLRDSAVAHTSDSPMVVDLQTEPKTATFTTHAVYYRADGTEMPPAEFTSTNYPASVFIRSVGTVAGDKPRTMESWVNLQPVYGGFGAAIVTMNGLNLINNLTLNGYSTNDADIYVNCGDLTIKNQPNIFGSIYVVGGTGCSPVTAGNATLEGNSTFRQNLWANGSVIIANPSTVMGNVISSTSSISVTGTVGGNATAGTTINGSCLGPTCTNIGGTSTPNTAQGPPPPQPLPQIRWVPSDWTDSNETKPDAPYTIVEFSTPDTARAAILNGTLPSGNVVVRINSTSPLVFSNNTEVTLNGNLAIVTDGAITFENKDVWTGAGSKKKLFLIDAYRDGLICSPAYDVTTANNTDFVNLDVFFYSPCSVNMNNQNKNFSGQILGGTVNINNQFVLNYVPVRVPGAGEVTGFREDIAYIREVVNTS